MRASSTAVRWENGMAGQLGLLTVGLMVESMASVMASVTVEQKADYWDSPTVVELGAVKADSKVFLQAVWRVEKWAGG